MKQTGAELRCDCCGYCLEGLGADGRCPECGASLAWSSPVRVGTAWQRGERLGWLKTGAAMIFAPRRTMRTIALWRGLSVGLGTVNLAGAAILPYLVLAGMWGYALGTGRAYWYELEYAIAMGAGQIVVSVLAMLGVGAVCTLVTMFAARVGGARGLSRPWRGALAIALHATYVWTVSAMAMGTYLLAAWRIPSVGETVPPWLALLIMVSLGSAWFLVVCVVGMIDYARPSGREASSANTSRVTPGTPADVR